ncbi:hypothetical protein [Streptomyces hydrogenans]|uniref:hypothetical protein n=1 Tax=Streptomyces hydrogenans TaxID=1873719 RepID=UPI0035E0B070
MGVPQDRVLRSVDRHPVGERAQSLADVGGHAVGQGFAALDAAPVGHEGDRARLRARGPGGGVQGPRWQEDVAVQPAAEAHTGEAPLRHHTLDPVRLGRAEQVHRDRVAGSHAQGPGQRLVDHDMTGLRVRSAETGVATWRAEPRCLAEVHLPGQDARLGRRVATGTADGRCLRGPGVQNTVDIGIADQAGQSFRDDAPGRSGGCDDAFVHRPQSAVRLLAHGEVQGVTDDEGADDDGRAEHRSADHQRRLGAPAGDLPERQPS